MNFKIHIRNISNIEKSTYNKKESLCIIMNDFNSINNNIIQKIQGSIHNWISNVSFIWKNSEQIKDECDSFIVNKWMEEPSDESPLDIYITFDNWKEDSFEQLFFDYLSISTNDEVEIMTVYLESTKNTNRQIELIESELKRWKNIWWFSYDLINDFN